MRSTVLITLAILAGLAVLPAVADDSEAWATAELDFFDGRTCVGHAYLIPGSSLKEIPTPPSWADGWATAEGQIVTTDTTFSAGSHVIVAYKGTPTNIVPPAPPIMNETDILFIVIVVILVGCGVAFWIWYRKMNRRN